ncbi:MAG: lipocalin-like domain-containing protein [Herpetosiphon sp.]
MEQKELAGTWRLLRMEFRATDGRVSYPYGTAVTGQLMYDMAGNLAVMFMPLERVPFAVNDKQGGTPEEAKAAIDSCTAYFGRYAIDPENGTLTHDIAASVFPNWSGTRQQRRFELRGNQLVLQSELYSFGGTSGTSYLVWEREA